MKIYLLLFLLLLATVSAVPKEKVLIGFHDKADVATVAKHGEVTHQYKVINAVAAELPHQAIEALQKNPHIAYIEEDIRVHAFETLPWGVDRIDAEHVWGGAEDSTAVSYDAGEGIYVAVIDTGVDYTHPELNDVYAGGYDFVNNDADPLDDNGHGTHVSGIVVAEDNDEGVIGVSPKVNLQSLKVLDASGGGYLSDVVAGIDWAVAHGADVISLSLGAGRGTTAMKDAVDRAYASGVLIVAAAGNDGQNRVAYPAAYDSVIAVSASDPDDAIASYSNTGGEIEIASPGTSVLSTMPTYRVYLNRYGYSQDYAYLSGTSMATPHVSGVAALVLSRGVTDANGNGIVNDEVRYILQSTAEDVNGGGWDRYYGYGIIDAQAAVAAVDPVEPDTTAPVISEVSANEGYDSAFVFWTTDEEADSIVAYSTDMENWDIVSNDGLVINHDMLLSNLASESMYYYYVSSLDAAGNQATDDNNGNYYTLTTSSVPSYSVHADIVMDIDVLTRGRNRFCKASATVTIYDQDGQLTDAAVEGTWSGAYANTVSAQTTQGTVTFTTDQVKDCGTFTFTVDDVVKAGYVYDAGTSATITV